MQTKLEKRWGGERWSRRRCGGDGDLFADGAVDKEQNYEKGGQLIDPIADLAHNEHDVLDAK